MATSFGSGAGSDSFAITVTKEIEKKRKRITPVRYYMERKKYLSYGEYVKHRKKIKM